MKNFNIMGVHQKIQFLGEGFTKNQCIGEIAWKRGLRQSADLRGRGRRMGGLSKKEGAAVFLKGGWYPNAHYEANDVKSELKVGFWNIFINVRDILNYLSCQTKTLLCVYPP